MRLLATAWPLAALLATAALNGTIANYGCTAVYT